MSIKDAIEELKNVRLSVRFEQHLPSDEVLDEYERAIGLRFPDDYRFFLKEASDSHYGGLSTLRVTADRNHSRELLNELRNARQIGLPGHLIPFCEDNGDYYCVEASGKIVFWSHDGLTNESWPSLESWIREGWIGGN
ncbi:MAG: SMI1/KNR4 family protein [Paracoccaceae bacterium]|nr:SMI1/KNR4 family protein [Paracoccaceae bacterium]